MSHRVIICMTFVLLCSPVKSQEDDEISIDFPRIAENFCKERKAVFSKCLDLDVSQCTDVMARMFERCAQKDTEKEITSCMDDEWLSYLKRSGLDPEAECSVEF